MDDDNGLLLRKGLPLCRGGGHNGSCGGGGSDCSSMMVDGWRPCRIINDRRISDSSLTSSCTSSSSFDDVLSHSNMTGSFKSKSMW